MLMYKIKISLRQGHTKVLGSHPQTVRTYIKIMETKKTWEYVSSRTYP